MTTTRITIETDLLAAIAKWASDDDVERGLGKVVFRDGEIIATDARRMIRAPLSVAKEIDGEPNFGVLRRDVLAAIAAQNVLARDGIEPPIDHDLVTNDDGDSVLADGPYGRRVITLRHEPPYVVLAIGNVEVRAGQCDLARYPTRAKLDEVTPRPSGESPPDGIIFQPSYMADVHEVNVATGGFRDGVRCTAWSGRLAGMVFETRNGVRMVVLPMKPEGWLHG